MVAARLLALLGLLAVVAGARLTARSDEAFVSQEVCRGTVDQGAGGLEEPLVGVLPPPPPAARRRFCAAALVECQRKLSQHCRPMALLPPSSSLPSALILAAAQFATNIGPYSKEAEADRVARLPGAPTTRHQPNIFSG